MSRGSGGKLQEAAARLINGLEQHEDPEKLVERTRAELPSATIETDRFHTFPPHLPERQRYHSAGPSLTGTRIPEISTRADRPRSPAVVSRLIGIGMGPTEQGATKHGLPDSDAARAPRWRRQTGRTIPATAAHRGDEPPTTGWMKIRPGRTPRARGWTPHQARRHRRPRARPAWTGNRPRLGEQERRGGVSAPRARMHRTKLASKQEPDRSAILGKMPTGHAAGPTDRNAWIRTELKRRGARDEGALTQPVAVLPPNAFSDAYADPDPRFPTSGRGPECAAIAGLLNRACCGWPQSPTAREFYEAMRRGRCGPHASGRSYVC